MVRADREDRQDAKERQGSRRGVGLSLFRSPSVSLASCGVLSSAPHRRCAPSVARGRPTGMLSRYTRVQPKHMHVSAMHGHVSGSYARVQPKHMHVSAMHGHVSGSYARVQPKHMHVSAMHGPVSACEMRV